MTMEIQESLGIELDEMASKNYEKIMSEESCHQCKVQKQVREKVIFTSKCDIS
jgi:hypothetical protein